MNENVGKFYQSLYFKLTSVFLVAVVVVSLAELYFAIVGFRGLASRINQRIEWNVAADIANEIQPRLLSDLTADKFREVIHPYAGTNPKLEFYLLLGDGTIFSYYVPRRQPQKTKINLDPILESLQPISPTIPHYGEDPTFQDSEGRGLFFRENGQTVFSAAPIQFNRQSGYLYIVLEGGPFLILIRQTGQYFLAKIATAGGFVTILGSVLAGYLLFRVLTKRFQMIAEVANRYQQGDYSKSLRLASKDEIGVLSRALDRMAEKLVEAKAEIEARDLNRRNMVACLSHDIRSPLQTGIGYLELAMNSPVVKDSQELKRDLSRVRESLSFQRKLIDDLFELSKLEAREQQPQLDSFSLEDFVANVIDRYRQQAADLEVSLTSSSAGSAAYVVADRAMLQRIFGNLIENSLRFTPAKGKVSISTRYSELSVDVRVSDTGCGLNEQDAQRLLGLFAQGQSSQNENHSGAGLGLAIVQRALQLHGSQLRISRTETGGALFSFSLDLEQ